MTSIAPDPRFCPVEITHYEPSFNLDSATMTATTTTSTWKSPSHTHSRSRSSRSSTTTPRGYSTTTVGQTMPPPIPTQIRSPQSNGVRSPDSGYFGFVANDESMPPDSNPGFHVKQNWEYSSSSRGSFGATSKQHSNETNPAFELFRRQSEHNHRFSLGQNVAGLHGKTTPPPSGKESDEASVSPTSKDVPYDKTAFNKIGALKQLNGENPFFDIPRQQSPVSMTPKHTVADHQHARLSLPASELKAPLDALKKQRSETVPQVAGGGPEMVSAQEVANLLNTHTEDVLVFDLRVYQQYAASRVRGALNLCLPTTLLKRPTFTVQKLADTFTSESDKQAFSHWRDCRHIVVYDASSMQVKEAVMPFNVLKKFTSEGWKGRGLVVKGGFLAFSKNIPQLVDRGSINQANSGSNKSLKVLSPSENIVPVAGGCSMPSEKSAANPFFGNIRQNMDLLDGVGQMPIKKPIEMSERDEHRLPKWLREASLASDQGKEASDKFLHIERSEQKRMQQALSAEVSYGTPHSEKPDHVQVAGIEKGAKNRYNNIFPYEHTRVKLQGVPQTGCDYVNANYVKASYSNRRYIATQAPIPATFDDFWRVVWEQEIKVIVMLTAESEGGQVKSHAYWNSGDYDQLKLKKLSERQVSLEKNKSKDKTVVSNRPQLGQRRSTQPHTAGEKKVAEAGKPVAAEAPVTTVRHFTLSHNAQPFQPMREITQIQYTQWPDFGAPTSPSDIVGLIELVNKYVGQSGSTSSHAEIAAQAGERPIIVHCSAGCGRTGTFCTIDSVIDMLKRQKSERLQHDKNDMDVDVPDDWIARDDIDLVAKTVADFRIQRLSMVQNLRQFVLCYESVIQWVISQGHEDSRIKYLTDGPRRSYQGSLG